MPPIFDEYKGLKIYATSHDIGEPIHVHVGHSENDSGNMKIWITDAGIEVAEDGTSLTTKEKREAVEYVTDNTDRLISAWIRHFKRGEVKHSNRVKRLNLD